MIFCKDCEKEIETKDDEIIGGKHLLYKEGDSEYMIFKCDECFAKNPSLTHYKPTEVYSRVVGYIRPVGQWHKGKQAEWNDRKEFTQEGM